jgi:hypothetical protein
MKKNLFLTLFLFWTSGLAFTARAEPPKQYRYGGLDGISLAWNGSWDVGVGTFEGGFGYKRWLSDRLAVKSFLAFGKVDTTMILVDFYPPVSYRIKEKSFSLLIGLEDHFWRRDRLSFFWGGSVRFSTSSSEINYSTLYDPPIEMIEESTKDVYTVQTSLGLEYFLYRRLSISGQYLIDLSFEKQYFRGGYIDRINLSQTQKQKTTSWNLGTGTSLLMFTVYL